ncbi:MAG: SAM-dependent methyltransferase, partial [Verrucomicrobiae bacterium]|nr:SAM-dependent methyltransferase [Verrucomicrobiae bacterium]
MNRTGIVSFVGVGPGDPNLMTVRGTELVRRADVLVYDSMLNREILEFAQQGVEQIVAGAPETSDPSKIAQIMLTRARDGKRVARLVCGDPYFTMEVTAEIDHVARSGVRFEVVPGVPFALVLPSRLGIPLFHPQHRTGFSIVALANCDEMPSMELASVCKGAGTKVILGRLKEVGRLVDDLLSQGLDPDTPAALVRSDRKGKPQAITGSVRELGALATQAGFETADVIVVGDVVLLRSHLNWVDKLPLAGQRIAVTRAKDQAGELTRLFLERGAEVLEVPCIKIEPPTKPEPLAEALAGLGCYDWIIFTSVNGVTAFFDHFFRTFEDLRDLGGARIAAVGP